MKEITPTQRQLSSVTLTDLKRYLLKNNWKFFKENNNGKEFVFISPVDNNGNTIKIRIPKSENYQNYHSSVNDIISIFSIIKKQSPISILNELSLTSKDIMRMRILNQGQYKNSIPLEIAALEIDAIRNLHLYSACSEVIALPHFERPLNQGRLHVKNCQFGHTFEGSFGFTIDIPVLKPIQDYLFEEQREIPFERKTTERIISGFNSLHKAREKGDPKELIDNFENGFNARMCDALMDISIEKTIEVEFGIDWSNEFKPNESIKDFKLIKLDAIDYELIEITSKELKKVEPYDNVIIGKVTTLHSNNDPNSDDDFIRTIIIKHIIENKTIDVKLNLNKEHYLKAHEAHGSGKTITVKGKLFRTGNTWKMNEVESLEYYIE